MNATPTLIVITGPTAVGKTAIAIALAKELDTEIISADSRQCYQGMAIGTAQPSATERAAVPHHFIDCYPVSTALSAADYERIALAHLEVIFLKKNTAIVCGGTGLYIQALCEGLDEMPDIDEQINTNIHAQYQQQGISWLRNTLHAADPSFAEQQNPARMLRALVFKLSTGSSISDYRKAAHKPRPFRIIKVAIELDRATLYERINQRAEAMMEEGLLQEARALYPQRQLKNLNTVGYTELFAHFDGTYNLPEAISKIQQHSRNYAKRQLTWLRRDPAYHWFSATDPQLLESISKLL